MAFRDTGFRYTNQERAFMSLEYYSVKNYEVRRRFEEEYPNRGRPDNKTIHRALTVFRETGTVEDQLVGNVGPNITATTKGNIKKVEELYRKDPKMSIRRAAAIV